eukprot:s2248_g17.t1
MCLLGPCVGKRADAALFAALDQRMTYLQMVHAETLGLDLFARLGLGVTLAEMKGGLTLEGWCEEALGQWKRKLGPDGEVKIERESPSVVSCVLSLLLTVVLLCATAAAFVDYPLTDTMQDWWSTPQSGARGTPDGAPVLATDATEVEAPRGGVLMLVLGGITTLQLIVLILAMNFCMVQDKPEEEKMEEEGQITRKPTSKEEELWSS